MKQHKKQFGRREKRDEEVRQALAGRAQAHYQASHGQKTSPKIS